MPERSRLTSKRSYRDIEKDVIAAGGVTRETVGGKRRRIDIGTLLQWLQDHT